MGATLLGGRGGHCSQGAAEIDQTQVKRLGPGEMSPQFKARLPLTLGPVHCLLPAAQDRHTRALLGKDKQPRHLEGKWRPTVRGELPGRWSQRHGEQCG